MVAPNNSPSLLLLSHIYFRLLFPKYISLSCGRCFFSNIWCETTHISSCHSQTGDNFSRVNHNRCIKIVTFYNHHWPSIALGHFNPFTLRTEIYYFIQRENVIYLFPLCCVWRIGQRTRKRRQKNIKTTKKQSKEKGN